MRPSSAPAASGAKASAWSVAVSTPQRRCERMRATPQGVASCSSAPTSMGCVATSPAAASPYPAASAKAGTYASPAPTMKLKPTPSPTISRRSRRSAGGEGASGGGAPPRNAAASGPAPQAAELVDEAREVQARHGELLAHAHDDGGTLE